MIMTRERYQAFNNFPLSHDPPYMNEHVKDITWTRRGIY
jgi:hypothetical protein